MVGFKVKVKKVKLSLHQVMEAYGVVKNSRQSTQKWQLGCQP
jgi:hypothetical protein